MDEWGSDRAGWGSAVNELASDPAQLSADVAVLPVAEVAQMLGVPVSRACVGCAFTLYQGILDEIERADYDVLHRRVAVPNRRRAAVAVPGLARALVARARSY